MEHIHLNMLISFHVIHNFYERDTYKAHQNGIIMKLNIM